MGNFITVLIVFYVISVIIGSLLKKGKSRNVSQRKTRGQGQKDFQAKFEQYFGQVEKYLEQQSPPSQPPPQSKLLSVSSKQQRPDEPYLQKPQQTQRLVQDEMPLPELELPTSEIEEIEDVEVIEDLSSRSSSFLSFDKGRGYLQGILLLEILGPPVSRRRRRFPR